jgi:hypothetical protein
VAGTISFHLSNSATLPDAGTHPAARSPIVSKVASFWVGAYFGFTPMGVCSGLGLMKRGVGRKAGVSVSGAGDAGAGILVRPRLGGEG